MGGRVSPRSRKSPVNVACQRAPHGQWRLEWRDCRVNAIGREHAAGRSGEGNGGVFEERRYVIGRLAVAGRAAARPGGRAPQRSFVSGGLPVDPARSATPGPRRDAGRSQNPCGWFPRRACPGGAVQRFARTVPKLGTAQYKRIRFQVCLASPDEAPIRSAYGRHPPRSATFGPGADVRDVTGEVGQQEAGSRNRSDNPLVMLFPNERTLFAVDGVPVTLAPGDDRARRPRLTTPNTGAVPPAPNPDSSSEKHQEPRWRSARNIRHSQSSRSRPNHPHCSRDVR